MGGVHHKRDHILRPGSDWRQEIDRAIRDSFVLIVVVSPDSKASEYVTYEWAFALGLGQIQVKSRPASSVGLRPSR